MSFRNLITPKNATLGAVSYEDPDGDFLSGPKNLSGSVLGDGSDVSLNWDPPDSEITVFSYELFVDGSFHKSVQGTNTIYEGMEFEIQYDFQVRAVGPTGVKSPFSNQVSFTGGGLPTLDPIVFSGEFKAASIHWQDISDNQHYTIEGYNVYGNLGGSLGAGDKLNSALLPLDTLGYTFFFAGLDTSFNIGVSFEYDGGQESDIFSKDGTSLADTSSFEYIANQRFLGTNNLVGAENANLSDEGGILVKAGTSVKINVSISLPAKQYYREWSSPDEYDILWDVLGLDVTPCVVNWKSGCSDDDGIFAIEENSKLSGLVTLEGSDTIKFYISRGNWAPDNGGWFPLGFLFNGPQCPDRSSNLSIIARFSVGVNEILEENLVNDEGGYFLTKKPANRDERLTVTISENVPRFSWYVYWGVFKYELYIRSKGSSNWGNPVATQSEGTITGFHEEEGLSADTYEAKVRFIEHDGSTYYSTESNVIEFTIS